ncbi:MAG TPA: leucine--tRNA ligase [bacterium]|jgi:leucyl-tRNA synthetase|nr:leucine--tRNA ligase [bacterium]HOF79897.1 leucine--tRNA ligase [bacterium]HOH85418.1 leucine--tRNA ligase [bacterium]HOQ91809.1 leucine--tRNA ligase [bacterium]HPL22589.1 leucine--tRNA ligase [bacterium]
MSEKYQHHDFEARWEKLFQADGLYVSAIDHNRPKLYILDMFPYPSGAGLHVGHPKGYIATDIVSRYQRMRGYNVLHPIGWDAFGLPAENYALKNKVHPSVATANNIATFKRQLGILGLSYDWQREINTTDPQYYRWTQWIFLKFYNSFYDSEQKKARPIEQLVIPDGLSFEERRQFVDNQRLAYESNEPINWCPSCQTGLANEDLENGLCERCGSPVELKPIRQWVLRITKYADRLLDDLAILSDWEDSIKDMQRDWIGRSQGALVTFTVVDDKSNTIAELPVFTTRPDTLFGCSYVAICPEQALLPQLQPILTNWSEVKKYIDLAKNKTDLDRTDFNKDKTGVRLEGCQAINPVNGQPVPIFVADYVLGGYGSGAIMAVPAHDERDFAFAQKYNLPIKQVIASSNNDQLPYTGDGRLINSQFLDKLDVASAAARIIDWLTSRGLGRPQTNYRLKDWTFSRQRYWGEPIPMVHCQQCGTVAIPENQLPVTLPQVDHYEPSGTGESPLVNIKQWLTVACPICGQPAQREANTMPQWAGSSWYYLRYIDPTNQQVLVDKDVEKYWSPVDLYVGGAEHATRHLIYARFWHKFLYDLGIVNHPEPFIKLRHVGLIMGEDSRKMSKRWNNVVNPDDMVKQFGADALRLYEMFMGPFDQSCAWNTNGIIGTRKFLDKVWSLQARLVDQPDSEAVKKLLAKTIIKVGQDIEQFKFNTAVSALMILVNKLFEQPGISRDSYQQLLIILSPLAPYISQEIWYKLGNNNYISQQPWPVINNQEISDKVSTIVVQFNGKTRGTIEVSTSADQTAVIDELKQQAALFKYWPAGQEPQKIIFLPGRLINLVF